MPSIPSSNHHTNTRLKNQKRASLGVLRGRVILTIQTHQAQRLIQGRRGGEGIPAILGLIGFAERLKMLWQGARTDDPYAHWWLLKVDQSLKQARAAIRETHGALERMLEQGCVLDVSIAASLKPERVELRFANPYAFLGAQMLAEFDRLVCTQLTLGHIGLALTPAMEQGIQAGERKIRSTFLVPQGYHFLGVDRGAVEQGTVHAQRAVERMGQVPDDVLVGKLRATLAPKSGGMTTRPSQPPSELTLPVESVINKPDEHKADSIPAQGPEVNPAHNGDSFCRD